MKASQGETSRPVHRYDVKRSRTRIAAILAALYLSLFIGALDVTIVATAAPTISKELESGIGYTWIGGAFLLANAASGPLWAKSSDIWGRKPILLFALAMFLASSAACGASKTMRSLIIGRSFQGAAGGGLILLVHVCISDIFSLKQRSLLMGLTEAIWALAGGLGPILGGAFASLVSWRWCFYINLPVCGVASVLIFAFLDIKHQQNSLATGLKAVDWTGIFCFLSFTLMVLLGLDFGGIIFPWNSAKIVVLLVVGVCMIPAFIYSETKIAKHPLIPVRIFKTRTNLAVCFVVSFHGFAFIAAEYYMPTFFQAVLEASPLRSGILLLPFIVVGAAAGLVAGIYIHRTGRFRQVIWVGTTLLCLGCGLFISFDERTTTMRAIPALVVGGVGSGILFQAPLIALHSQIEQKDVATATATLSFVRSMSLSISTIIGGTIFQNSMDSRQESLRRAGLPPKILHQLAGENALANVRTPSTLQNRAWKLAAKASFAWAIKNMWITYTAFAFLAILAGLFIRGGDLKNDHTETVTGQIEDHENN